MPASNPRTQTRGPQRQPVSTTPTPQENAAAAQRNAEGARKTTALDVMASRLNISAQGLKNTLLNTVFKKASDDEFAALIIVANEYKLNPLTKEIYAFPAKGGGIVPVVSIDGWIRIMNEHPQFDGIEFEDIADDEGKLLAIEAVIYRKDRTRPIRITEYLDECKQSTDPWRNMPSRMLRHKATIQCARYAFGFSGIYTEDDAEQGDVRLGGDLTAAPMRNVTPLARQIAAEAEPEFDRETGEVDRGEGPSDQQRGEQHLDDNGREIDPVEAKALEIVDRAKKIEFLADYNTLAAEMQPHIDAMMDEDMAGACNRALRDARNRVTGGKN